MQLEEKTVKFKNGRKLRVSEASFDMGTAQARIEAEVREERARLNGSGDPVLLFFKEAYYAALRSHSIPDKSSGTGGENIPSIEEALELDPEDLDRWYLALVAVNPSSYITADREAEGKIEFRDGSSFRILSGYRPSVQLRRARLEAEALAREEDKDNPKDIFAVYLYPLLASCSIGQIPRADELRKSWPQEEIFRWRDAVKEINPHWFDAPPALATPEEVQKKKGKSRKR